MRALSLTQFVREPEIVDLLRDLIRIDSSNPPGLEEPVAQLLADFLAGSGLEVTIDRFEAGRANLVARWCGNGRKSALLFSGHLDTVPASPVAWTHPPHSAAMEDGVVYGRGAVDMKGAVAAMAGACLGLARARMELAGDVIFAGSAGEEVDCAGARRLVSQGIGPVGELVVGEATRLDVAPAHKGALWIEIETAGKAAHGSMPNQGSNAILFMRDVINRLDGFRADVPAHPLLGPATVSIGTIRGGTKPNIVPEACTLTVDLRTLPGESHADILEQLRSRLGGVAIRTLNSMPAVETPVNAPLIESALEITRNLRNPNLRGMTYFSDASVLAGALGVPTLIFGPGDERLAHQANEHIAVDEMIIAAQVYFELAQRRLQ